MADIIHFHGFRAGEISHVGALTNERNGLAHHVRDWADQIARGCDDVTADIGKCSAATCRIKPPCPRNAGVGHEIFGVNAAKISDFTQFTACDNLLCKLHHGVFQIVETHSRLDTLAFCGQRHFQAIGDRGRQRLFTIDMLSGLDGRQSHFLMEAVGGGDIDEVDVGIGNEVTPVASGMGKAQLPRGFAGCLHVNIAKRVKLHRKRQVEDAIDIGKRQRVGFAHEAGTDQACYNSHFHPLPSRKSIISSSLMVIGYVFCRICLTHRAGSEISPVN